MTITDHHAKYLACELTRRRGELTATPLQNSLLELFGLISFIDEHAFGDLKSLREQFAGGGAGVAGDRMLPALRERLRPLCHRTLHRQVQAYVPYTRRHAILEGFTPAPAEEALYALVSDHLRRDNLQALPAGQRALITLVPRKLLASSTFAIAGALETMARWLRASLTGAPDAADDVAADHEALDETADEWGPGTEGGDAEPVDRTVIEALAGSIDRNAKGEAPLQALGVGFAKAVQLGAERKAIIFTESRRTQAYLLRPERRAGANAWTTR